MEIVGVVIVVVVAMAFKALFNDRVRKKDEELEQVGSIPRENFESDSMLNDRAYRQWLLDQDNKSE